MSDTMLRRLHNPGATEEEDTRPKSALKDVGFSDMSSRTTTTVKTGRGKLRIPGAGEEGRIGSVAYWQKRPRQADLLFRLSAK